MKILVVCHRLPFPPNRGGKIRPFNIIRHLGKRHDVTVATLARSPEEAQAGASLADHCARVIVETVSRTAAVARMVARLPTRTPSSMGYFYSPRLAERIRREVSRTPFDLILVHCAFVAPYVAWVPNVSKLLDFGDVDSQKWLAYAKVRPFPLSLGYYVDGVKLRRTEVQLATHFDLCTCTTREELKTLASYGVQRRLGWFPNGVDTEYFKPDGTPYDPDLLCFVGRMDYYPNQEGMIAFCRDVLPLIRARRPGVRLTILGAAPSARVLRLGTIPGVTVTGTVPDVRPHLRGAAVSVAPLTIARGTQNKILESMAIGVPAVASVEAAKGVDAEPGRDFLTATSPREYASTVLRLLEDPDERTRISEAGRARVLSHHSWDRSMRRLDDLVEECVAARRASYPSRRP
jgi:sugar transferase (PEP-CTERM/EpsH1 system associated)